MENKRHLHEIACPGCGSEPEVRAYYKRGEKYLGYHEVKVIRL